MITYNITDPIYSKYGPHRASIDFDKGLWIRLYYHNGAIADATIENSLLLDLSKSIKVTLKGGHAKSVKVRDLSRIEVIAVVTKKGSSGKDDL